MTNDERFMRRALQLAKLGQGHVSPNPMVGCVIVYEGRIIGEGWHQNYGDWHAEINAINAVENKVLLSGSTIYVTLEPCSHFGKTPPCADRLVQEKVKKVVIANVDTNPLVGGKGIEKLRTAGIEVITGILEAEGHELNRRFFTFMAQQRPYLVLKWAETADGFIAKPDFQAVNITNALANRLVHRWRAEVDAIMVGTNTAQYDNPHLNVRLWHGKNPIRIVIDKQLRLPESLYLFDNSQPTICYNLLKDSILGENIFVKIDMEKPLLPQMMADLYQRKIQSVLIEGGTNLLQSLLDLGLWDEIRRFRSPKTLSEGIKAPQFSAMPFKSENWMDDELMIFRNPITTF